MRRNRKTRLRYIAMVLFALLLMGSTYGFTATNTVPTSKAGSGASTVSGYTVSEIHYNLNTTTPTSFASLNFNVAGTVAAGSSLKVNDGTTWGTCTAGTYDGVTLKTPITCSSVTGAVTALTSLQVVVAD